MSANVHVAGLMTRREGGLKESLAEFRKHHQGTGDALLNISGVGTIDGLPCDKEDPRPVYNPKDHPFPSMVYHAEKGELVVNNHEELKDALNRGWRKEPLIRAQVALEDPRTEKLALQKELKEKDGQIAILTDTMTKMMDRLEAMELREREAADQPSKKGK